jgi:GNAT superfamily N-acetyltransferase
VGDEPGHVRLAGDADADVIATVWLSSRRASFPAIPAPVHSDEEVRRWVAGVLVPGGGTWVFERDDGVVAMLTLREGWVEQLYVDPRHFGRRAGSELLGHAKRCSPAGLDLWTFQANTRARRFYETRGFVAVEETSGMNEEGAPDVRYHWGGVPGPP